VTIDIKTIAWLAGILEGEGCFLLKGNNTSPCIQLKMKDEDIIKRVASLWNVTVIENKKQELHWSQTYQVNLYGNRAVAWMFTIYSFMGKRRQAKIKEVVAGWKNQKRNSHYRSATFSCGHSKNPGNIASSGKHYIRCRECSNAKAREIYAIRGR